ncbi:hypothetical protein QTO34_016438 [Cnephaeus nilssonii]|uniref:Alpha-defensin N-terminal domain-containing protein n=1 Tax=Cnephaeus nilssonii TaxID=3371016 RepID=A0AA40I374_CNENI|nr:hypothetical protein QTO34_016438 [Eptesicus nilssonii]
MRTLALLAVLLLLALQAQARTLQERADQVLALDQPEAKDQGELLAEDQDLAEDGDQDVAISFTGEERLAQAAGETPAIWVLCIWTMRTLTLLTALLLLALQAQAGTLQETADQVPAQDQPEAKDQGELWAEDQDQAEDGDQDVAISFTGEERLARAAEPRKIKIKGCHCRRQCRVSLLGELLERVSGVCKVLGRRRKLCCK